MYFEKAGKDNTELTLKLAIGKAKEKGIKHIVLASTTGETALKAIGMLADSDIKLIVVTHNTGFKEDGMQEFSVEARDKVQSAGGVVYSGTMVLRNLGRAIKDKVGSSEDLIVRNVLVMLGQGTKVCVEIVAMAADAGLIPFGDVIAVAGTGWGADTAMLIKAKSSNKFFDMKIREYIAKPADF